MPRTTVVGGRSAIAAATALCLAVSPTLSLAAPQASKPSPSPAAPKAAPKAAAPAAAAPKAGAGAAPTAAPAQVDGGWPRGYATPSGGKIVIYQPQMASWDQEKHMVAYSAVSYEMKGAAKPALGSLKIEADTKVSVSERLVNFSDFKITESNFPTLSKDNLREVVTEIDKAIPDQDRV